MNTSAPQPFAEVRGSWESVLNEANRLAANFNDDAIAHYEKVYVGLLRIPDPLRKANDNRLHTLLMRAGLGLHAYLNYRDQYAKSLETLHTLLDVVEDDEDRDMIQAQILDVQILAEEYDKALSFAVALAEEDPDDVHSWGGVALTCTRIQRAEQAWPYVDRMIALVDAELDLDSQSLSIQELDANLGETERDLLSYLYGVEAMIAIENEDYARARSALERVIALEGVYFQNLPVFYTRLIARNQFAYALELLEHDTAVPSRAAYWRGLTFKLQGNENEAKRIWQEMVRRIDRTRDQPESSQEQVSTTDYVLARFQLGDAEGIGLQMVLSSLRENRNVSWLQFMLAGLGWILRGDRKSATTDLDVALARYKSSGDGAKLPLQYWLSVATLFDDEAKQWLSQFFQTELPNHSQAGDQPS